MEKRKIKVSENKKKETEKFFFKQPVAVVYISWRNILCYGNINAGTFPAAIY